MSDRSVRMMHCPACGEQISPLRALFGLRRRPFDCSRCRTEIEIAPNGMIALWFPGFLAFQWVKAEYGDTGVTWAAFVLICLVIAIVQLIVTPVRRFVPR